MGIGGALIMPATLSILTNVFRDPRERGRAIAIWAGFSGLGVALGPVVGGLLLKHFSWSSVFWVNLPIGLTALVAGVLFIPTSKDPSAPRIDIPGAVMSIVGLGALLFGIIEGPSRGWTDPLVLAGFALGLGVLAAFIAWELHTEHPMLDMRFFRNPRFSVANGAITLTFFAMFGSLFLMTQYWQLVHGYTPLQAGVRLIPFALTMMVVAPLSARVVEKLGTKRVVTGGLLTVTTALVLLSFIQRDTAYPLVIAMFCLMAVGMGLTMAPATESVMGSLPREKAGVGSAVNDTTRQVGGALGVAIIGSIVSSAYASKIASSVPGFGVIGNAVATAQESLANALGLAPQTTDPQGYVDTVRDAFVHSLSLGLRFSAVVVLIAAVLAWRFLPARAVGHHFTPAEALTSEAIGARAAEEEAEADEDGAGESSRSRAHGSVPVAGD
jgi:EmrB/QacA subfamily drug resistance transporter